MKLSIHIDGGSRGNPGPAAAGVVIRDAESSGVLHEGGYYLGSMTNNAAEYKGLLLAIGLAGRMDASEVHIHSDSELLVRQMIGEYRVKSPALQPLHEQAKQQLQQFDRWHIKHVYRERNQRADELANLAMDAGRDVVMTTGLSEKPTADKTPITGTDVPRLRIRFISNPDDQCPAEAIRGDSHVLGPTTPDGLCVYAAHAVLQQYLVPATDGSKPHPALVRCTRCQAKIQADPV